MSGICRYKSSMELFSLESWHPRFLVHTIAFWFHFRCHEYIAWICHVISWHPIAWIYAICCTEAVSLVHVVYVLCISYVYTIQINRHSGHDSIYKIIYIFGGKCIYLQVCTSTYWYVQHVCINSSYISCTCMVHVSMACFIMCMYCDKTVWKILSIFGFRTVYLMHTARLFRPLRY